MINEYPIVDPIRDAKVKVSHPTKVNIGNRSKSPDIDYEVLSDSEDSSS